MIGSNYLYNGKQIDIEKDNYLITLDDNLSPRELNYSDQTNDIMSYHGVNTSPTYARGRVIGLSGYIISDTKTGFGEAIDYLDQLFSLQSNTAILKTKKFSYTDDSLNDWEIDVKIKVPIIYETEDFDSNHFIRKWTVVLLAPKPQFLAIGETSKTGSEGFVGGVEITDDGLAITDEGISLNEYGGQFIINPTGGNQPLEPRFEIEVIREVNGFLRLHNKTTGNYIQFNIEATAGQKFIIDSYNETATLDGVNIMGTKTGGSFITIEGETILEIYDEDMLYTESDINVTVFYKNILL